MCEVQKHRHQGCSTVLVCRHWVVGLPEEIRCCCLPDTLQLGCVEQLSIGHVPTTAYIDPQKLVITVHQAHQHDWEETFVVVVQAATVPRTSAGCMFPIKRGACMGHVPSSPICLSNDPPFCFGGRTLDALVLELLDKGLTHFTNTHTDMVLCGTLKSNFMLPYLSPEAKCRIVIASFKPGSRAFRYGVSCLVISGPNLSRSSSNMSGGTRRKLK